MTQLASQFLKTEMFLTMFKYNTTWKTIVFPFHSPMNTVPNMGLKYSLKKKK